MLFYCDHYPIPLPPGHKFPIGKYRMLRDLLTADGEHAFTPAPLAGPDSIRLAHDHEYVSSFLDGSIDPRAMRRIGFPWSEDLVRRTLCSAGATLAASSEALSSGFSGALAGGTHHAFRSEGSGFCVFNDLAIAILHQRAANGIERGAVIDLDVHQGDGTAAIFEGDPQVFTLSLHGAHNFPFRKKTSTLDIALPDGTGDQEYLARLAQALPLVFAFGPQLVFYQSGVDGLASDSLGRLALTHAGLLERDRMVLTACRDARIPTVLVMGGGYSDPIGDTVMAHAGTFRQAARIFGPG